MKNESYPIQIISEQRELLEDEVVFARGKELEESEQKLAECITALEVLRNYYSKSSKNKS